MKHISKPQNARNCQPILNDSERFDSALNKPSRKNGRAFSIGDGRLFSMDFVPGLSRAPAFPKMHVTLSVVAIKRALTFSVTIGELA